MSEFSIRIERDRNGLQVSVCDPKIVSANKENRKKDDYSWESPHVEYQFQTKEQVMKFVEDVFDDALPADEYSAAFDKAAKDALNDK